MKGARARGLLAGLTLALGSLASCGAPTSAPPIPPPPAQAAKGCVERPEGSGNEGERWPGAPELVTPCPSLDADSPAPSAPASAGAPAPPPADTAPPPSPKSPLRLHVFGAFERITLSPRWDAPVIGLVRAGQSIELASPLPLEGPEISTCGKGWYPVLPRGYVCSGRSSTLDAGDPRVRAAAEVLPNRARGLPFFVGTSAGSPQYTRIPTRDEQRSLEPDLDAHLASPLPPDAGAGAVDLRPAGKAPSAALLAYLGAVKPALAAEQSAYPGMRIAWADELAAEGRTFLLTTDLTLIPKDRVRIRPPTTVTGIRVERGTSGPFPLAFLWLGDAPKLRIEGDRLVDSGERWPRHAFVPVTGGKRRLGATTVLETREGAYLRFDLATVITPRPELPRGVGEGDKWLQIRITHGYLVAYEGKEPVYASPMSPGANGLGPGGFVTPPGTYWVYSKALSWDMSGTDKGKPWKVDEVPWVAFFKDNYALHGAWWHDDFGRPKSHGCVNLPPEAARDLFDWLDPKLPEGWYLVSAYPPKVKGTAVVVMP